jgi:hypothetical protein|tara:strand:- start:13971 stop:14162 length:192 start_codon:yes stop_codon:yes gene_type:complete
MSIPVDSFMEMCLRPRGRFGDVLHLTHIEPRLGHRRGLGPNTEYIREQRDIDDLIHPEAADED